MNKPFGNRIIIAFIPQGINNSFDRIIEQHDREDNEKWNPDQNIREKFGDGNKWPENDVKENGLQRQALKIPVFEDEIDNEREKNRCKPSACMNQYFSHLVQRTTLHNITLFYYILPCHLQKLNLSF